MDQLLGIKTSNQGVRQDQPADYHQHEVTSYFMLDALFKEYTINKNDEFVDFGSGQGRIIFYVHYHFQSVVNGIEMNELLYKQALENKRKYMHSQNETLPAESIQLTHCLAEEYEIKTSQNRFYFFNPFAVRIFRKVVANILESFNQKKREIDIILYYPSPEYIDYLEKETPFTKIKDVEIPGLYRINNRERFSIFRLEV